MAIQLNDTPMEAIISLAEGNPGAAVVMGKLMQDPIGFMDVLHLDDMGMKGPQIWVAFEDHCKGDIEALRKAIRSRDPELVATVNRECPDRKAVCHGASFSARIRRER